MAAYQVNCGADAVVSSQHAIFQHNDITREFPGVAALAGTTFDLRQDETRAVLGENRADRSPLIKGFGSGRRSDRPQGYRQIRSENRSH
ncbi:hypothetical protein RMR21_021485 [Agrobacterium sp. rho-8.1]|jgi:ABC-type sugar transport system ATPase subunit|nr:hypothetical protein [Agrobacterium sp. rho-8.1]